jgi:hypothetical protein
LKTLKKENDIMEEIKIVSVVPYQLCPKCNGYGGVWPEFMGTSACKITCDVCSGAKIIPMFVLPEIIKEGNPI